MDQWEIAERPSFTAVTARAVSASPLHLLQALHPFSVPTVTRTYLKLPNRRVIPAALRIGIGGCHETNKLDEPSLPMSDSFPKAACDPISGYRAVATREPISCT